MTAFNQLSTNMAKDKIVSMLDARDVSTFSIIVNMFIKCNGIGDGGRKL